VVRAGDRPEDARLSGTPGFERFQTEVDQLLRFGVFGKLDLPRTTDGALPIPKIDLAAGERIEWFGRNALVFKGDKPKEVYYKGRTYALDDRGNVRGIRGMHFDAATKTLDLRTARGLVRFDVGEDKTTIELGRQRTEITRNGISYIENGRLKRFVSNDRSFSIEIANDGTASVKGPDSKDMKAGHPYEELRALHGKKPEIVLATQSFAVPEGKGKRTFYPGSHSVLREGDKVVQVSYGIGGLVTIDGNRVSVRALDGREHVYAVNRAAGDLFEVGKDGFITLKLNKDPRSGEFGKIVEIDPKNKSYKVIEGKKATVMFAGSHETWAYSMKLSKDDRGNWGVTELKDERGFWDFEYKPPASRDFRNLAKVTGPAGVFEKGDKIAGFHISPSGDVTVQYKPGQKFLSATYKPAELQEVYRMPSNYNVTVKYELAGPLRRVAEVKDGLNTYKPVYKGGNNIDKLLSKDGKVVCQVGVNATKIEYVPEFKGFRATMNDGSIKEIDPSRKSARETKEVAGKKVTTETFSDGHQVVSEKNGKGETIVRSFTNTRGQRFEVEYEDQANPDPKQIKTILSGGRPIPQIQGFARQFAAHGFPKITVDTDGSVVLNNGPQTKKPDGDRPLNEFRMNPDGRLVLDSGNLRKETDDRGLIVDITLRRPDGPPTGITIERGVPVYGGKHALRDVTLKQTGESLKYNPWTHAYEFSTADGRVFQFLAQCEVAPNGDVFINSTPLGQNPQSREILAALSTPVPASNPWALANPGFVPPFYGYPAFGGYPYGRQAPQYVLPVVYYRPQPLPPIYNFRRPTSYYQPPRPTYPYGGRPRIR